MTRAILLDWQRPRTDTAAWRRAIEISKRLDLSIEVANSAQCAARNGRFWIVDLSLRERAGRAETLEQVLTILARYEKERPTGNPEGPPWPCRLLGWRPW